MTEPLDPEKLAQARERLRQLRDQTLRAVVDGDLSLLTLLGTVTAALAALKEVRRQE